MKLSFGVIVLAASSGVLPSRASNASGGDLAATNISTRLNKAGAFRAFKRLASAEENCPEGEVKCGADPEHGFPGWCTRACCDFETEEECWEDGANGWEVASCAKWSDGGCPCPEGEVKCGADPEDRIPGWCTRACCDLETEEVCYDDGANIWEPTSCAKWSDGGCPCPEGEVKCGAGDLSPGWCTRACCDFEAEEECYDYGANGWEPTSCAKWSDGGCPCPEGEFKCGADPEDRIPGWCSPTLCCDFETEEECYEDGANIWEPTSCAKWSDGGCPCAEGEVKCGADPEDRFPGWCTRVCCDLETEEECWEDGANGWEVTSCAKRSDGGCTCAEGEEKCGAALFIEANGTPKEIASFHTLRARWDRLHSQQSPVALDKTPGAGAFANELRLKEMQLIRGIKRRLVSLKVQ